MDNFGYSPNKPLLCQLLRELLSQEPTFKMQMVPFLILFWFQKQHS